MRTVIVQQGDALALPMADNFIDAVVCDPPYGIEFMGNEWDGWSTPNAYQEWCRQWATEALRVLKPGGYMLAFGGTRTYHRLTSGVEDAGFEIRDSITWLYGSGMPKGKNALKPASEPIVVARKPFKGTVAANVEAYGTGGLNIDASRVPYTDDVDMSATQVNFDAMGYGGATNSDGVQTYKPGGRWPANVVIDDGVAEDLGEVARYFPVFKYQAKAPKRERPVVNGVAHPTVKPLELIQWLVRLVTPTDGIVLDMFAGSGTTGQAANLEGFGAWLIEREPSYIPLIHSRLNLPNEGK